MLSGDGFYIKRKQTQRHHPTSTSASKVFDKGNARKFYEEICQLTEGLKTGENTYKNRRDDPVTDDRNDRRTTPVADG